MITQSPLTFILWTKHTDKFFKISWLYFTEEIKSYNFEMTNV